MVLSYLSYGYLLFLFTHKYAICAAKNKLIFCIFSATFLHSFCKATADYVLKDYKNVVRIFIYAPEEYKIRRLMEVYGDSREEAKHNIYRSDKARGAYYKHISGKEWGNKENYELIIDSSCGIEKTANTILEYVSNNAGNL